MTVVESRRPAAPGTVPAQHASWPARAPHRPCPGTRKSGWARCSTRVAAPAHPARHQRGGGRDRDHRRDVRGRVRQRRPGPGRRHGQRGLRGHRDRLRRGGGPGRAGDRAVALRRRPAARGRGEPARGGHRVRRDDPGLRRGAADLGGARRGGRRRRLRAGPDRRGDLVRPRPHLRHRPRRGAQRDRRGRGHGPARRPGAAQPPVRGGAPGRADRRRRAQPGPGRRAAARPASRS